MKNKKRFNFFDPHLLLDLTVLFILAYVVIANSNSFKTVSNITQDIIDRYNSMAYKQAVLENELENVNIQLAEINKTFGVINDHIMIFGISIFADRFSEQELLQFQKTSESQQFPCLNLTMETTRFIPYPKDNATIVIYTDDLEKSVSYYKDRIECRSGFELINCSGVCG